MAVLCAAWACESSTSGPESSALTETTSPDDAATSAPSPITPSGDAGDPPVDAGPDVTTPCVPPPQKPIADSGALTRITVEADKGPRGTATPVSIDRGVFGMNIADWRPQDYTPAPSASFRAMLNALGPGFLRWPAGHRSQEYVWARGGGGQSGHWTMPPAQLDAFIALAKSVGAEPLIGINVKRGTPAAAADLVRYLNVDHPYAVRWFYIGNEPDLTDGMTPGPNAYADQVIAFTDAMRAVDPAIKFVGPELLTGAHVGGMHGTVDWMTPILARVGARLSGLSWHYYPLDSAQPNPTSSAIVSIPHLFQETANDWRPAALPFADEVMPALATMRDAHAPGATTWITEIAEDPGPAAGAGVSNNVAGALWVADTFGRYASYGPGAIVRFLFKSDSHSYALIDGADAPRPTYGAYWILARVFGDKMVSSRSDAIRTVNVHSALREDAALSVLLVNKTSEAQRVHVALSGFCARRGEALTLTGDTLASEAFTINGQALTSVNVTAGIAATALDPAQLFELEMPAASMRVVSYEP